MRYGLKWIINKNVTTNIKFADFFQFTLLLFPSLGMKMSRIFKLVYFALKNYKEYYHLVLNNMQAVPTGKKLFGNLKN